MRESKRGRREKRRRRERRKAVLEGHSNLSDRLVLPYALFSIIITKYYELFTNALLH